MTDPASLPTVPVTVKTVDADTVFAALGDRTRRRILVALFDGQPRRATTLSGAVGKRFDATLKHLVALRNAGLIVAAKDPTDTRRQIYTLRAFGESGGDAGGADDGFRLLPGAALNGRGAVGWSRDAPGGNGSLAGGGLPLPAR